VMQVPASSITARRLPHVCVGTGGGNPSPGQVRSLPVVVPPSSGVWGGCRVSGQRTSVSVLSSAARSKSRVDETIIGLAGADQRPLGVTDLAAHPRPE